MFRAIFADNVPTLSELGHEFLENENLAAAVLCLDQVYSHLYALEGLDLVEIATCFRSFLDFARALQRLTCQPDPCNHNAIQRLLAFKPTNGELFAVGKQGHLFTLCNTKSTPSMQSTADGLLILRWELEPLVQKTLRERLEGHVWEQNEICHTLRCLQPCLLYAVHKSCPKKECHQYHVEDEHVVLTYNMLVRIHLIQIMIFHTLYATNLPSTTLFLQQRYTHVSGSGLSYSFVISLTKCPCI